MAVAAVGGPNTQQLPNDQAAEVRGGSAMAQGEALDKNQSPKFSKVWADIQAKMGVQPEKPREIKKKLDKDDFLRIMISQMKYQDPTKPFDAEKMATEMAQITSMEQMQNMNKTLDRMTQNQNPMQRLEMTSLIGKSVVLDRNRFPHSEGHASTVSFTLPEAADKTKVTLISAETGEPVFTKDLGMQDEGQVSFTWDGLRNNSLPAKGGNYMVRVDAETAGGKPIATKMQGEAKIIGVSFDGGEPSFLVGDAKNQQKVPLSSIMKVQESFETEEKKSQSKAAPSTSFKDVNQAEMFKAQKEAPKEAMKITAERPEKMLPHSSNIQSFSPKFEGKEAPIVKEQLAALTAPSGIPKDQVKAQRLAAFNESMNAPQAGKGFPNGLSQMAEEQKMGGKEQ